MAKIGQIQVDPKAELEGVWIPFALDIEIKVARLGNKRYDAAIRSMSKPFTQGFRAEKIPDGVLEEITKKALAAHVIKGWRNLEDDKGKPIKFSAKKALELFQDDANRDFYKFVISAANDAETFRRENLEEAKGN